MQIETYGQQMDVTPALRSRIQRDMELASFTRDAIGQGMQTLRASAAQKVAQGLTTITEVLDVLPPPE